jgi:hypothetical protein
MQSTKKIATRSVVKQKKNDAPPLGERFSAFCDRS